MEAYNDFTSYVSYQQKCSNFILSAFVSTWEKKYSFKRARWVVPVLTPINGKTQSDSLVAGSEPQWIAGFFLCQLFLYVFIQTHIQIILQRLKTKQDWTIKNIPSESLRRFNQPTGSEDAPYKVHAWPHLRKLSLLRAPCKVLRIKYVLRIHWNHYNRQWTGPQILHRKKVALWLWLLSNEWRAELCLGLADTESLLTFAITPGFWCPTWCAKVIDVMQGVEKPATPSPLVKSLVQRAPAARPVTIAETTPKVLSSIIFYDAKNKAPMEITQVG